MKIINVHHSELHLVFAIPFSAWQTSPESASKWNFPAKNSMPMSVKTILRPAVQERYRHSRGFRLVIENHEVQHYYWYCIRDFKYCDRIWPRKREELLLDFKKWNNWFWSQWKMQLQIIVWRLWYVFCDIISSIQRCNGHLLCSRWLLGRFFGLISCPLPDKQFQVGKI